MYERLKRVGETERKQESEEEEEEDGGGQEEYFDRLEKLQFAKQNPLFRGGRGSEGGMGETGLQDVKWKTGEKFVNYRSFRRWTVAREVDILLSAAYYRLLLPLSVNPPSESRCVSLPALATDTPPRPTRRPFPFSLPLSPSGTLLPVERERGGEATGGTPYS